MRARWWRPLVAWLLMAAGITAAPVGPEAGAEPATAIAPTQVASTYANPLTLPSDRAKDPFIMRSGDTYYAYVSGYDFIFNQYGSRVFTSTDLVHWGSPNSIALPVPTAGGWADRSTGHNFTSPSVREIGTNPPGERFVMYFTGIDATSGDKCIGVATSSSPIGPFVGRDDPLICPPGGAQDPSAIAVPDGAGFQEVVYVKNGGSDAGIYNQVLSADGQSLDPNWSPLLLYRAQPNWWHEGIVERPAVLADSDGNAYLTFSGGTPDTGGRAMGWSPCLHMGVIASCHNQTSLGTWIAGTSQVDAPSGAQPFTDEDGRQWLVYDGWAGGSCSGTTTPCTGSATMRIDKVCFAHGQPRTNAPSTGTQNGVRDANCSNDVPPPPGGFSVASSTDDATLLTRPGQTIELDGVASAAAGGKVLWTFGDTFAECPGTTFNNTGGFGVRAAAADGPNWVDLTCTEAVPRTAAEVEFEDTWKTCTPPPGGTCQTKRFTMWSAVPAGLPDGSAVIPFSKTLWTDTFTPDGPDADTHPDLVSRVPTALGVGLAPVTAANVAAGTAVADRIPSVSCDSGSSAPDSATGCLFDESLSPHNSDRFWRAVVDGGYLYLFSDATLFVEGSKVARAPLGSIGTPSAWQYWSGPDPDDWTSNFAQSAFVPGLSAGSIHYNPYLDRYVNSWGDLGGGLITQVAESLTGPWTDEGTLHDQVECPSTDEDPPGPDVSYDGRIHPELNMDGGRTLAIVYFNSDNLGTADPCIGGSRFATVRLG